MGTERSGRTPDPRRRLLAERALELSQTLSRAEIAERLGVSLVVVKKLLYELRQANGTVFRVGSRLDESPEPDEWPEGPRCSRCGLSLPCNDCLPTARELAERRPA